MNNKNYNWPKIHPGTYLVFAALFLLFFITWIVFIQPSTALDDKIFDWVTVRITEKLTSVMRAITFLGNYQFLLPANLFLIAVLLILKQNNSAWRVTVIALSSLGLKLLLKELFHRVRPDEPMIQGITNFSFPSGHAFMSVAFYGLLIWITIRTVKSKTARIIIILFLSLLILLIGFSRIYLRVHYTTDVLAGFCIGGCWVFFCLWLTQKISKRFAASGNISEQVNSSS